MTNLQWRLVLALRDVKYQMELHQRSFIERLKKDDQLSIDDLRYLDRLGQKYRKDLIGWYPH